jgi:hypothetical protein
MNVNLTPNVVGGVFQVSGPIVVFDLTDTGQADVVVVVALADGTKMSFPDDSGAVTRVSTSLPPGKVVCTVLVAAFTHGAFGSTYNASVSIGGHVVATAVGTVAAGGAEKDSSSFVLQVL